MKLSELIDKLVDILNDEGDLECVDAEFHLPINKVVVKGIIRGEVTGTVQLVIGRDE